MMSTQVSPGDLVQRYSSYHMNHSGYVQQIYGIVIFVDKSQYSVRILCLGKIYKVRLGVTAWMKVK